MALKPAFESYGKISNLIPDYIVRPFISTKDKSPYKQTVNQKDSDKPYFNKYLPILTALFPSSSLGAYVS